MALQIKDFLTDAKLDEASDVFVADSYAYVASPSQDRLTILDISDPDNISIEGSLQDTTNLNLANAVCVVDDYAYVAVRVFSGAFRFRITVVDVSNKAAPSFVASSDNIATSLVDATRIHYKGGLLFVGYTTASNPGGIAVMDISTPTTPKVLTIISEATLNLYRGLAFDETNGVMVSVSGATDTLATFDVKSYLDGVFMGSLYDTRVNAFQTAFDGTYLYVAESSYFTIIDCSDPTSPSVVGSINDAVNLSVATDLAISGSYAFVAVRNGITSINISNKSAPSVTQNLAVTGTTYIDTSMHINGNYAYITQNGTLYCIDISNPASMVAKDNVAVSMNTYNRLVSSGNYLYIVSSTLHRLSVVNISDETNLTVDATLTDATNLDGTLGGLAIYGSSLLVATQTGITEVDISTPTSPTYSNKVTNTTKLTATQLFLDGSLLYCLSSNYLTIVNPSTLTVTASVKITNGGGDIRISGNTIVTSGLDKMFVLDKSALTGFSGDFLDSVISADYIDGAEGVVVDGLGYAYVACYNDDMVSVWDISDPTTILLYDYLVDGTKLNGVYDIYYVGGYLITTAYSGDYVAVISTATMTIVDSITDATDLNGAKRLYRNLTELYVACYDGDGLAVLDISGLLPVEFTPKVMLI